MCLITQNFVSTLILSDSNEEAKKVRMASKAANTDSFVVGASMLTHVPSMITVSSKLYNLVPRVSLLCLPWSTPLVDQGRQRRKTLGTRLQVVDNPSEHRFELLLWSCLFTFYLFNSLFNPFISTLFSSRCCGNATCSSI